MKFEFKARFTAKVIYTQEIPDDTPAELQCKVALELAVKARAYLARAYLADANLAGANLADANLGGANLGGANLAGANLAFFKQDFIAEVLKLPNELDALRTALIEGRINGSTYSGECACLAGTLAKARGIDDYDGEDIPVNGFCFKASVQYPREQWFLQIKEGDTPKKSQAAKIALEWLDEAISMRDHIRKAA